MLNDVIPMNRSNCNILAILPALKQVAISPFGVVNYMTVYLGDVLTSTVKVT